MSPKAINFQRVIASTNFFPKSSTTTEQLSEDLRPKRQRFYTSYNTSTIQCTWYKNHLCSFVAQLLCATKLWFKSCRNIYNHKFNVSILLTIPLLPNVHGIKLIFAVLLQIQLWRLNLSFIIHETALHAMYMVQQSAFYFSPNTNFATKIADKKITPPFWKKKWPPFW